VQMTRKRTRESLTRTLCEQCSYCEGKGFLKSQTTVCYEILRSISRQVSDDHSPTISVTAHPEVIKLLFEQESDLLDELQKKHHTTIQLNPDPNLYQEQFEIVSV
jgi:ribonuclease G